MTLDSSSFSEFGTIGVRVVTSSLGSFISSIDCFGRALAIDNAYRHLTSAEQYLLDAQKMQDTAPHTDKPAEGLDAIESAKVWIRPYAISPDDASCRDPPVCVVDHAGKKLSALADTDLIAAVSIAPTGEAERIKSVINFI